VCTTDGKPRDPDADSKAWARALKRAGLPHVPLHAARHSCASLLRDAGVAERVIQSILGHTDVKTTQGYAHQRDHEAFDAMRTLATVLPVPQLPAR